MFIGIESKDLWFDLDSIESLQFNCRGDKKCRLVMKSGEDHIITKKEGKSILDFKTKEWANG